MTKLHSIDELYSTDELYNISKLGIMNNLCDKYDLFVNIKKLKAYKLKLKNSWTLWFHSATADDWSLESYTKIYEIKSIIDFWRVFNNHYSLYGGMYFFMKNDIKPVYEDSKNKDGGYWSIKISINDSFRIWKLLCLDLLGNSITKKEIVNGVSICKKKKFFILKIWIKDVKYKDLLNIELKDIDKTNILFNKFTN